MSVNPIVWVQGLEGTTLIVAICALMFIEEVGVPLPFAPGDLVLAIGGIAIAGGRVHAALFVGAATVAILTGAVLGREITALLGWQRLMRIAEPLHARKPLERAAGLLQRGGWRAVFTARLIPGLRVYTTQVAGVAGTSRRTFVSGLVPATVVYIGAFVGVGAAFGRPILALIHEAEHQVVVAVLLGLAVLALFLLTRAPVRRALVSLEAAGWHGPLKFGLDSAGPLLILSCLGLNFAGHAIAVTFKLPFFLDSVGTVLAGVVGGPWLGGSVGFISNLVSSNTVDPIAAPYGVVSFAVGFAAGLSRYLNWHKRLGGWVALWLLCFTIASVVSTPINFLFSGGNSGVGFGDGIYAMLRGLHLPGAVAAYLGEAAVDLPDKLITVVAALLIVQGLPEPRAAAGNTHLDLGNAFTFVIRSRRWVRKFLVAVVCTLFFWLVIPFLLLLGYFLEISRQVRDGVTELPPWNRRWSKIQDGFKFGAALLIWYLPSALLSIPGAIVEAAVNEGSKQALGGTIYAAAGLLSALGSVWGLVVVLLEAALISEYLRGGFRATLHVPSIIRRLRVNLGLTLVIGALVVVLSTIGLIGLAVVGVGVLITFPYASFVASYLVGLFARLTEHPAPDESELGTPGWLGAVARAGD